MIDSLLKAPPSDRERAKELYDEDHFALALPLYEEICRSPQATGWDVHFMAKCLSKLERYAEALDCCRRAWKMFSEPRPDAVKNLCGWCVYHCDLKPLVTTDSEDFDEFESDHPAEDAQTDRIQRATKAASSICEVTTQGNFSPFAKGVLTVAKILKRIDRWPQVEEWTARLDPAMLSRDPWTPPRRDNGGTVREIASDLETSYGYRTKALLKVRRYAECVELCQLYECSGLKSHYDWDVWVPYYRAQALRELNRRQEAHSTIDGVIRKKRAPSVFRLKASLLLDDGDKEAAWRVALDGALELHESKNDPELVLMLARLAKDRGELDAARGQFELILSNRSSQDWKIPEQLRVEAENAGVVLSGPETVQQTERRFREMRRWWWKELASSDTRTSGSIERVTDHSGFVRTAEGDSLYFNSRDFKDARPGMPVDFWVRESSDFKKARVSKCAIRVRQIRPPNT
jgi:tetratricopeptide (TPR) repeat protein